MTACSAAMTAMHAAIGSLTSRDSDPLALCCSSNYLGNYFTSAGFAALGVLSPDGHCKSFDESANGYKQS